VPHHIPGLPDRNPNHINMHQTILKIMTGSELSNHSHFLTVEIGSTITKVNAFTLEKEGYFRHQAQGFSATSIALGDVTVGVNAAIANLESRFGKSMAKPLIYVNSSAAGGLRMTVHGLTTSMTARAAREAALGAGAIVKKVTAGLLDQVDLDEIRSLKPNIILLAGGVEYGEKHIVLQNAELLKSLDLNIPIVYAGNSIIRPHIRKIFENSSMQLLLADNVFPVVDVLNITPLRKVIHEVFNQHIIHAPGMQHIAELTDFQILPTPAAVLNSAELFAEVLGDCLVIDVGGATTDVHSVTNGSSEWMSKQIEPEPYAKRTVEGDLGVYVNAKNIVALKQDFRWQSELAHLQPIPHDPEETQLTQWLCSAAVEIAIRRHAGQIYDQYTPSGKKQILKGKDLSAVQWVIGTGGALTRIAGGEEILRSICTGAGKFLLPPPTAAIWMDTDYLFSALGTLAQTHPQAVKATFQQKAEMEVV